MDAGGAKGEGAIRGRPSRVVLTPRRRRQVGGNSFPPMTVTKKPDHRGEHEVSRKTIARGMPGNPGVTVVTTLVCFLLCTRGCGRIRRPAFPAPSEFRERTFPAKLARKPAARSRSRARPHCVSPSLCLASLRAVSRRHCEERRDEAIHSC